MHIFIKNFVELCVYNVLPFINMYIGKFDKYFMQIIADNRLYMYLLNIFLK